MSTVSSRDTSQAMQQQEDQQEYYKEEGIEKRNIAKIDVDEVDEVSE
jgi:hypothetical protein